MFCPKCGTENKDGNAFCQNCGTDMRRAGQAPKTPIQNNTGGTGSASQLQNMMQRVQGSGAAARIPFFYITVAIAAIQALMPFMKWFEIPAVNSLYGFLGGSNNAASFSLFGLLFNGGAVGGNTVIVLISWLLCLFAFLGSVFDILYIAKGFPQKKGYYKYGKIASIMLLVISLLFVLTFGLIAAASAGVFKVKAAPWIVVISAVANLILIGQVKRAEN